MDKNLTVEDLQTAQEQWMTGVTAEQKAFQERLWYIPQGVLRGLLDIDEAITLRNAAGGHFESRWLAQELGINSKLPISIKFSKINRATKMTLDDPKVAGLWNEDEGAFVKVEGRDLTQEAYNMLREKYGVDLHLHPTSGEKEKEIGSLSEQKG